MADIAGNIASMAKNATPADSIVRFSSTNLAYTRLRIFHHPFTGMDVGLVAVRPKG